MIVWIVFFLLTTPLCIWAAWSDLKFMKIPNILSVLLALVFIVSGVFLLPFDDYLWRILIGLTAFFVGFLIYLGGVIGGGDIKLIAAMLPFVAPADMLAFAFLISVLSLAGVAAHRLIGKLGLAPNGWLSWQDGKKFPFGFTLAGSLMYYLVFNIIVSI